MRAGAFVGLVTVGVIAVLLGLAIMHSGFSTSVRLILLAVVTALLGMAVASIVEGLRSNRDLDADAEQVAENVTGITEGRTFRHTVR